MGEGARVRSKYFNLKCQAGFSLIEVLVASTIFSIGLAGVASLLATSISASSTSRKQSVATRAATSLADQMRLNGTALSVYLSPTNQQPQPCSNLSLCSPTQQAELDFYQWKMDLTNGIPGAVASVCLDSSYQDGDVLSNACDGSGGLVIKIFWDSPNAGNEARKTASRLVFPVG